MFYLSFQVTRVLCGAGCLMLVACAVASLAVGLVRQHHRQQELIKITAIVQLVAGTSLFHPFMPNLNRKLDVYLFFFVLYHIN